MGKLFRNVTKDSPEVLKVKGTPVSCCVKSIRKNGNAFVVEASPTDGQYVNKLFTGKGSSIKRETRIGGYITCYVDEEDADGEYFLDI